MTSSSSRARQRQAYQWSVDHKDVPTISITETDVKNAIAAKHPNRCFLDKELDALTEAYIAYRQEFSTNFGHFKRVRLRRPGAVKLSIRNARFLCGLAGELRMNNDDKWAFSLDFFALETYCKALLTVISARTRAARKYQLVRELMHIITFIVERAHINIPQSLRATVRMDGFAPFALCEGALSEASLDKKTDEQKNLSLDEQELVDLGKFIPLEQQVILQSKIEAFFKRPDPEFVLPAHALAYQSHLVLHLLSNAIIPVVRSQVLVQLKIGTSFRFNEEKNCFTIDSAKDPSLVTKTAKPVLVNILSSETAVFKRWMDVYRRALLPKKKPDPGFLFLTRLGKARTEISYSIRKLASQYIVLKAGPHAFRSIFVVSLISSFA
jgi:hypothetical protein